MEFKFGSNFHLDFDSISLLHSHLHCCYGEAQTFQILHSVFSLKAFLTSIFGNVYFYVEMQMS
jgi:hypothetical protein